MLYSYCLPDPLPWNRLWGPLARAEDLLARLDERLRTSSIRDGFVARTDFMDVAASLALDGEHVSLEDLVLHDTHLDIRAPTTELVRAHIVLRARRRIAAAEPGWALSPSGMRSLRGRAATADEDDGGAGDDEGLTPLATDAEENPSDSDWDAQLAAIDAIVARSDRLLTGRAPDESRMYSLVYDTDWDETSRLADWRRVMTEAQNLPPVLAAVVSIDAWEMISPVQHDLGLGRLLGSAILRTRDKTRAHLASLSIGLRSIPHERRQSPRQIPRLIARLEGIAASAETGLKNHDRWLIIRQQLERKLTGRRSNSKLPDLVDLVLASPIVSTNLIADRLGVTSRSAQDMVVELGLREITGRGRYRAWGVI